MDSRNQIFRGGHAPKPFLAWHAYGVRHDFGTLSPQLFKISRSATDRGPAVAVFAHFHVIQDNPSIVAS